MTHIPEDHPRAHSLMLRERLAEGLKLGVVTETGLIAHGRGEALDYLLGERTHGFARTALEVASALLTLAKHPVISINGNVAALAASELVELERENPRLCFEVNIFHYSQQRANRVVCFLRSEGMIRVLESTEANPEPLPGLDSARKHMHPEGLAKADVVLVGLEDGDRCEALVASGRQVIAIDLNPLSRTAKMAHIAIVDELTRCLPLLNVMLIDDRNASAQDLQKRIDSYQKEEILQQAVAALREGTTVLDQTGSDK